MANGEYDLIVIGAGSAGLTAAGFAVQLGLKVALAEKNRVGGDCTWTGCVPSKSLLKAAKIAHDMRNAHHFGIASTEPEVDLKAVMARVKGVVEEVYREESPEALRASGIDVFLGPTRFLDPHTIETGGDTLTGRRFLIATGARPAIPPISGINDVDFLTYETLWDLEELPRRFIIIGGGPIGCEMAQAFCRLGSNVTLLEAGPRILPQDEPEASGLIASRLIADGVELRLDAMVDNVWQSGETIHVGMDGQEIEGDALLVAAGRRPAFDDLALDKAGVAYSPSGIKVNSRMRTNRRHIYAAGDCVGGYQFTHYAAWQGFMAVRNAYLPFNVKAVLDQVPWSTFTDPEVAHTGLTEAQARSKFGQGVMVFNWPMDQVDRALTEGEPNGFVKLVHKRNGTILGATIAAPRAGEMIQEWSLAIDQGLKIEALANSIHVYPSYATANMQAAAHIRVQQILSGNIGKVVRGAARLAR
jgi:pyruvate/2-oxoglutarate dehydrogenase complex dihydrolipoamide dehydrogenase (E3) component